MTSTLHTLHPPTVGDLGVFQKGGRTLPKVDLPAFRTWSHIGKKGINNKNNNNNNNNNNVI